MEQLENTPMIMIKLHDFASDHGVQDRAILKHVKKHEAELEGHFERRGNNGTFLDEYACQFIEQLLMEKPTVITNTESIKEAESWKNQAEQLQRECDQLKLKLQLMVEYQAKYEAEHKETLRLTDQAESLIERAATAEAQLKVAGETADRTRTDLNKATEETAELRKKNEELLTRAVSAEGKLQMAEKQIQMQTEQIADVQKRLNDLDTKISMLTSRSLWQRITRKGE